MSYTFLTCSLVPVPSTFFPQITAHHSCVPSIGESGLLRDWKVRKCVKNIRESATREITDSMLVRCDFTVLYLAVMRLLTYTPLATLKSKVKQNLFLKGTDKISQTWRIASLIRQHIQVQKGNVQLLSLFIHFPSGRFNTAPTWYFRDLKSGLTINKSTT